MSGTRKVLNWCDRAERVVMVLAFVVMVCTMFGSVLARNLFKVTITWFDELARIAMVYMVLLGAEAGLRDGTQVRVTAVTDKLKGRVKQLVALVAQVVLVGFTGLMIYGSIMNVKTNIERNVTTTSLNWPVAIPYMALVIGFTVATLVQLGTLVKMILEMSGKTEEQGGEAE